MKWFAHSSPEMTLTYAKIADESTGKEGSHPLGVHSQ
jgi:hypothetical protein